MSLTGSALATPGLDHGLLLFSKWSSLLPFGNGLAYYLFDDAGVVECLVASEEVVREDGLVGRCGAIFSIHISGHHCGC